MFQPTVLEGQLCQSLNIGLVNKDEIRAGIRYGLLLLIDPGTKMAKIKEKAEGEKIKTINLDPLMAVEFSAKIYLHTLGRNSEKRAGSYSLGVLKRMTGTENFMALTDEVKKCQIETFEKCNVRRYLEASLESCGCVPWALSSLLKDKVGETKNISISKIKQFRLCSTALPTPPLATKQWL